ncbi:hypothetical protein LJB42_004815 [Komagataella kurtzmanii]|nr:hypothetical protein LJB42_004815 [Komagataella kurtzmanii]
MFNSLYHGGNGRMSNNAFVSDMELQFPIINEQINSPLIFHTSSGSTESDTKVGGDQEYIFGPSPQPSASRSGISSGSEVMTSTRFKSNPKSKVKEKIESNPEWSEESKSNIPLIQRRLQLFLAMNYQEDPDTGDLIYKYNEDVSDAPPDLGKSLQTIEKLKNASTDKAGGNKRSPDDNSLELIRSSRIEILKFLINDILRGSGLIPRGENWYALTQYVSLATTTPSLSDFSPVTSSASSVSSTFSHAMSTPSPQRFSVDILLNLSDAENISDQTNVYQAKISLHFMSTACHPTTMMNFKDTFFPTITHNFRYLTPNSNPGGLKHVKLPTDMVLLTTEVVVV